MMLMCSPGMALNCTVLVTMWNCFVPNRTINYLITGMTLNYSAGKKLIGRALCFRLNWRVLRTTLKYLVQSGMLNFVVLARMLNCLDLEYVYLESQPVAFMCCGAIKQLRSTSLSGWQFSSSTRIIDSLRTFCLRYTLNFLLNIQ